MRYSAIFTASVISGMSMLCSAMAADVAAPNASTDNDWRITVSPYVWAASLNGNAALAGLNSHVNVPFSEIFDNLDIAVMGTVEIAKGPLGFFVDGQYVKTSQKEDVFANEVALKIKTTSVTGGVFYRVYERQLGGVTIFNDPQRFTVEPLVGLRWTKIEADVAALGRQESKSADWTDPIVGLRLKTDFNARWNLSGEADIGGFSLGSKLSVNAQAYLGYRMLVFDRPTTLRVGYRVLSQDYKGNDFTGETFKWDVVQHGPVVGLSMRF